MQEQKTSGWKPGCFLLAGIKDENTLTWYK
jgi:hypothetical protein